MLGELGDIDRVVVTYFEAPRSYTAEDVVETTTRILSSAAPLMAALRAAQGDAVLPHALRADAHLLVDRTQRWLALAEEARRTAGNGLRGLARARQYEAHR